MADPCACQRVPLQNLHQVHICELLVFAKIGKISRETALACNPCFPHFYQSNIMKFLEMSHSYGVISTQKQSEKAT